MTMRTDEPGSPPKRADFGLGIAGVAAAAAAAIHDVANAVSPATGTAANARNAKAIGSTLAEKGRAGSRLPGAKTAAKVAAKAAVSPTAAIVGRVVSSPVVGALSRVALPVLAARMAYDGYQGYRKDGVRGAALGAADAATIGLASRAYDLFVGGRPPPPNAPTNTQIASMPNAGADITTTAVAARGAPTKPEQSAPAGNISSDDMRSYESASRHYEDTHMTPTAEPAAEEPGKGPGKRGFANPKVQKAAQAARGVQNFSDWTD